MPWYFWTRPILPVLTRDRYGGLAALGLAAAFVVLLGGCNKRPRAPSLEGGPAYQNSREGFRFLAPSDWSIQAKADVPAGKLDREHMLVQYIRPGSDKPATLEVSVADLPATTDLAQFLKRPAFGSDEWRLSAAMDEFEVGGLPAVRFEFTAPVGDEEMTREVVAFRRGERTYFFTGLFPTSDAEARTQIRRAVQSAVWKK